MIVNEHMEAIVKLQNAQSNRIKSLENAVKEYTDSDLNEILKIQNQLKNNDRRPTN